MEKNQRTYKAYKRGQVVYVDLGNQPHGIQSGIRPCIIISSDASNHCYGSQITVCPLTTRIRVKPTHVLINNTHIEGYCLKKESNFIAENIMTISKNAVRGIVGYIKPESEIMQEINGALEVHLGMC